MKNSDLKTVEGFGREWASFDQNGLSEEDKSKIFDDYFHIFPWDKLSSNAIGIDVGCGSGRWAQVVAPRVGHLHLVDASQDALQVSKNNLSFFQGCVVKYVCRYLFKGTAIQDLDKIIHYCELEKLKLKDTKVKK